MSNPNPRNQFKKGHGPQGGRPKDSPELKAVRLLTANKLAEAIQDLIDLDIPALQAVMASKPKVIVAMVASLMIKMINEGDPRRFDCVMNRLTGKVPDRLEGSNGEPLSLVAIIQRAHKRREEEKE